MLHGLLASMTSLVVLFLDMALEKGDLLVEFGDVLFDNIHQLANLHWAVIKQRLAFCHYSARGLS